MNTALPHDEFEAIAANAKETMGGLFLANPCELLHEGGCVEILRKVLPIRGTFMQLQEFLNKLNAGNTVHTGSEVHQFMHKAAQEALKLTARIKQQLSYPSMKFVRFFNNHWETCG